jgi:hypothetical protein
MNRFQSLVIIALLLIPSSCIQINIPPQNPQSQEESVENAASTPIVTKTAPALAVTLPTPAPSPSPMETAAVSISPDAPATITPLSDVDTNITTQEENINSDFNQLHDWAFEETFDMDPSAPSQSLLPDNFDYVVTHPTPPAAQF